MPPDVKEAKKLTTIELQRILTEFLHLTPEQLMGRLRAPEATMLEGLVGSIIQIGIKDGCHHRLNFLFDRIVGKVKDQLEVSLPDPFILELKDGKEIVAGVKEKNDEAV